jgi:hypothetical protein
VGLNEEKLLYWHLPGGTEEITKNLSQDKSPGRDLKLAIMTELFRGLPQSLQANSGIVS